MLLVWKLLVLLVLLVLVLVFLVFGVGIGIVVFALEVLRTFLTTTCCYKQDDVLSGLAFVV